MPTPSQSYEDLPIAHAVELVDQRRSWATRVFRVTIPLSVEGHHLRRFRWSDGDARSERCHIAVLRPRHRGDYILVTIHYDWLTTGHYRRWAVFAHAIVLATALAAAQR